MAGNSINKNIKILELLISNLTIKQISKRLKLSPRTIYNYNYRLRRLGYITPLRTLTSKGKKALWGYTNFRLHNSRVTIQIPKTYNLKDTRYNILTLRKIDHEVKKLGSSTYAYFNLDKISVRIHPNCIVLYFKDILANTPQEATEKLMDDIFFYIRKLENLFRIKLTKDERLNISITSNEYAHIKDALAKKYRHDNNTFFLRDNNNELRLIVDFSNRVEELEAVHKDYAEQDQFIAQKHIMDWLKNNPPTNSELATHLYNLSQIQTIYNENILKHLGVLDNMEKNLNKLSITMDHITSLIEFILQENKKEQR